MKTKTLIISLIILSFCCFIVVNSCSKSANNNSYNNQNENLLIGSFLKDGNTAEMKLTFIEAISVVTKYNLHVSKEYHYRYTEVWIESLTNANSTTDYYLAARADVTDNAGNLVLYCYTTYFFLERDGDNLFFSPGGGGPQYTCTGHCCKSCKLEPAAPPATEPTCECQTPNTECGATWCDMTVTVTPGGTK